MDAFIRSAAEKDLPALAALKAEYLCTRYQGFAQAELLRKAIPDRYLPDFAQYMTDPFCHIDVLESDSGIESFMIYRRDAQDQTGWIVEARSNRCCGSEECSRLIEQAVLRLRQEGCHVVRTWLLRSNYRLRFLFESCGFRMDGERRIDEKGGQSFEMIRYMYLL